MQLVVIVCLFLQDMFPPLEEVEMESEVVELEEDVNDSASVDIEANDHDNDSHCGTIVAETLKTIRSLTEKKQIEEDYKQMRATSADFFEESGIEELDVGSPSIEKDLEETIHEVGASKPKSEVKKTRTSNRGKGVLGKKQSDDERDSVIISNLIDIFSPKVTGEVVLGDSEPQVVVVENSDIEFDAPVSSSTSLQATKDTKDQGESELKHSHGDSDGLQPTTRPRKSPKKSKATPETQIADVASPLSPTPPRRRTRIETFHSSSPMVTGEVVLGDGEPQVIVEDSDIEFDAPVSSSTSLQATKDTKDQGKSELKHSHGHGDVLKSTTRPRKSPKKSKATTETQIADVASPFSPTTPRRRTRIETFHSSSPMVTGEVVLGDGEPEVVVEDSDIEFDAPVGSSTSLLATKDTKDQGELELKHTHGHSDVLQPTTRPRKSHKKSKATETQIADVASPLSPTTPRRRTRIETFHSSSSRPSPMKEVDDGHDYEISRNKFLKIYFPEDNVIIEESDDLKVIEGAGNGDDVQVIDQPCADSLIKKATPPVKKMKIKPTDEDLSPFDFHSTSSEDDVSQDAGRSLKMTPKSGTCSPKSLTKIKSKPSNDVTPKTPTVKESSTPHPSKSKKTPHRTSRTPSVAEALTLTARTTVTPTKVAKSKTAETAKLLKSTAESGAQNATSVEPRSVPSTLKDKKVATGTPKSFRGAARELAALKQCALTDFLSASPLLLEESCRRYSLRQHKADEDPKSSIFAKTAIDSGASPTGVFGTPHAAATYSRKKRRRSEIPKASSDLTQVSTCLHL
jgi:hypothetical protein